MKVYSLASGHQLEIDETKDTIEFRYRLNGISFLSHRANFNFRANCSAKDDLIKNFYNKVILHFHILVQKDLYKYYINTACQIVESMHTECQYRYTYISPLLVSNIHFLTLTEWIYIPLGPRIISRLHDSMAKGVDLEEFYKCRKFDTALIKKHLPDDVCDLVKGYLDAEFQDDYYEDIADYLYR